MEYHITFVDPNIGHQVVTINLSTDMSKIGSNLMVGG